MAGAGTLSRVLHNLSLQSDEATFTQPVYSIIRPCPGLRTVKAGTEQTEMPQRRNQFMRGGGGEESPNIFLRSRLPEESEAAPVKKGIMSNGH